MPLAQFAPGISVLSKARPDFLLIEETLRPAKALLLQQSSVCKARRECFGSRGDHDPVETPSGDDFLRNFCRLAALGEQSAAQKPAPAAAASKGGWSTAEVPASDYDPAYAAYDSGSYEEALKLATEAAAKGEIQANTLIGQDVSSKGSAFARTNPKLSNGSRKGAVAGDKHAQFQLGVMLAKGRGVKKDEKKAADFFEAAAQQGHTLAAYNLAQTYVEGWARPQDMQKAAYWLEQAANKDHAQAAYDLSHFVSQWRGPAEGRSKGGAMAEKGRGCRQCRCSGRICDHACEQVRACRRMKRAPWRFCASQPSAAMRSLKTGLPAPIPRVLACPQTSIQAAKWHILGAPGGRVRFQARSLGDVAAAGGAPAKRKRSRKLGGS